MLIIVERDQLEVIVADHNHQRRLDSDIDNLDVVSKLLSSLQVELSVGILRFLIISPSPRNSDTVRSSHRHQLRLASNDIHTSQPDKRCLKRILVIATPIDIESCQTSQEFIWYFICEDKVKLQRLCLGDYNISISVQVLYLLGISITHEHVG